MHNIFKNITYPLKRKMIDQRERKKSLNNIGSHQPNTANIARFIWPSAISAQITICNNTRWLLRQRIVCQNYQLWCKAVLTYFTKCNLRAGENGGKAMHHAVLPFQNYCYSYLICIMLCIVCRVTMTNLQNIVYTNEMYYLPAIITWNTFVVFAIGLLWHLTDFFNMTYIIQWFFT